MKVFIVNDTTKIEKNGKCVKHFGCELTMKTYHDQFKRIGATVVGTSGRDRKPNIPKTVDLVVVNGEGSIHHGQRSHFLKIANSYPAVLLNAVWENNPHYPSLKKFRYISVRESLSSKQLPEADVVPDLVFASTVLRNFKKPKPKEELGKTDNVINRGAGFTAHQSTNEYLQTISKYKRICAGRFHAAIVASVLQIPFNVWQSNTHKMQALMKDMNMMHLFFKTQEEALEHVPATFDKQITTYVEQAQEHIERMFDQLHTYL